jgi:hypothetical protein
MELHCGELICWHFKEHSYFHFQCKVAKQSPEANIYSFTPKGSRETHALMVGCMPNRKAYENVSPTTSKISQFFLKSSSKKLCTKNA